MEKLKPKPKSRSNLITFSAKLVLPEPYNSYSSATDVRVPAGEPPFKLKPIKSKGEAQLHIETWAHNIRLHFLATGQWISREALCYFLQFEFEIDSKKWLAGCKIIQGLPDIVRPTDQGKKT